LDTASFDTGGMLDLPNGRIVAKVAGYYAVEANLYFSAAASGCVVTITKNHAQQMTVGVNTPGQVSSTAADVLYLNAGDYLELSCYNQGAAVAVTNVAGGNYLAVTMITAGAGPVGPTGATGATGPAVTPPSVVAAHAYRAAAYTLTSQAWQAIPLDTKAYDTGNNFNTATGKFVAPVAGYYLCTGMVGSTPGTTGILVGLQLNSTTPATRGSAAAAVGAPLGIMAGNVAEVIHCNAGDTLALACFPAAGDVLYSGTAATYLTVVLITAGAGPTGPVGPASTVPGPTGPSGPTGPGASGLKLVRPNANYLARPNDLVVPNSSITVTLPDDTSNGGSGTVPDGAIIQVVGNSDYGQWISLAVEGYSGIYGPDSAPINYLQGRWSQSYTFLYSLSDAMWMVLDTTVPAMGVAQVQSPAGTGAAVQARVGDLVMPRGTGATVTLPSGGTVAGYTTAYTGSVVEVVALADNVPVTPARSNDPLVLLDGTILPAGAAYTVPMGTSATFQCAAGWGRWQVVRQSQPPVSFGMTAPNPRNGSTVWVQGQPTALSAIQTIGANSASGTSVSLGTHQPGDMIIMVARRANNTPPTIPAAGGTVPPWTQIFGATGVNTLSHVVAFTIATASNHTSGTWTNAANVGMMVLRGNRALSIGASASGSGATSAVTFPALTLQRADGTSWGLRIHNRAGTGNTMVNPPAPWLNVWTQPSGSSALLGLWVAAPISANPTADLVTGGSNAAWEADTIEILVAPPPTPPVPVLNLWDGLKWEVASPSGTASGDLGGSYPSPTLAIPRARSKTLSIPASMTNGSVTVTTSGWTLGNGMAVSGNGIAVPRAGYYRIWGQVTIAPVASGTGAYIQLTPQLNGANTQDGIGTMALTPNTSYASVTCFDEVHCNAGDVLTLQFTNATGVALNSNGGVFVAEYVGQ
jgi:hypothetical protein